MEKGYLFILAIGFAANLISASPAEDCTDDGDRYLPIPNDCNSFYDCLEGIQLTCPTGLVFNPVLRVCDWPENVECNNFTCSEDGDRYVPIPNDCNSFYDCLEGIQLTCPIGLVFNPVLHVCDWPENVECNNFTCSEDGDRYVPITNDCKSFYDCLEGIQLTCPNGLVFNPVLKVCDWPENVQC